MFNAYEFTFAGESSLMYGLTLCDIGGKGQSDVAFGNEASIIETRTNGKIQPIHFGVNYHSKPLEFDLVFASEKPLDRYEFESVSLWLTGHQDYQWLSIDQPDLERVQYRCLITSLTPITSGWIPYGFSAHVICDCPYAYGYPFSRDIVISGSTSVLFRNEGSVREPLKPKLEFAPIYGTTELTIVNHSDDDRMFQLSGMPTDGIYVEIDNQNGIITEHNKDTNLYTGFNMKFFRLLYGDNELEITGDGVLTVSGRFLYNVAG